MRRPHQYAVIFGTVSALVLVVMLAIFKDSGILRQIDLRCYDFAVALSKFGWMLMFWQAVTVIGEGIWIYPAFALVLLAGAWRERSFAFARFTIGTLLIFCVNPLLKFWIASPRPALIAAQASEETSFGFPSGHSVNVFFVVFVLWPLLQKIFWNKTANFSFAKNVFRVTVVVLVGCSRVLLGFHWATDVLAGWLVGAVAAFFLVRQMESL